MPGIILHQLLAHQVLREWRIGAGEAPFALNDEAAERSFYQGSLGPDVGYYPGTARAISDLVHPSRSADMARAILDRARTPLQRAYAWGWVTHVLADVAVHPLIEQQAEAVVRTEAPATMSRKRMIAHLRVEAGLDAYLWARRTPRSVPGFGIVFSPRELRFLAGAYRETYGPAVSVRDLRWAQATVARVGPAVVSMTRMAALAQTLARAFAPSSRGASRLPPVAYTPVTPTPSLIRSVRRVIDGFAGSFNLHYASGLRDLGNHSLTSGRLDEGGTEQMAGSPQPGAGGASQPRRPTARVELIGGF